MLIVDQEAVRQRVARLIGRVLVRTRVRYEDATAARGYVNGEIVEAPLRVVVVEFDAPEPPGLGTRLLAALEPAARALAEFCARAVTDFDPSAWRGKTARPGRVNSMTAEEVRAFAARFGIRYPYPPVGAKTANAGGWEEPGMEGVAWARASEVAAEELPDPPVDATPPDPHAAEPD